MTQITDLYGNDDIEAMYQAALAVPLAEKIEMALLMIRTYESMALNLSEDGFWDVISSKQGGYIGNFDEISNSNDRNLAIKLINEVLQGEE